MKRILLVLICASSFLSSVKATLPAWPWLVLHLDTRYGIPWRTYGVDPSTYLSVYPRVGGGIISRYDYSSGPIPVPAASHPNYWTLDGRGHGTYADISIVPPGQPAAFDILPATTSRIGNGPPTPDKAPSEVGGTINLALGAEEFSRSYLTVQGVRTLDFSVRYSSDDAVRGDLGMLSGGWSTSYDIWVRIDADNTAYVHFPGGAVRFSKNSGGTWDRLTPSIIDTKFEVFSGGDMRITYADGRQINFNSDGKMVEDVDADGNKITFAYTSGNLTSATDYATGKAISFTYGSHGYLATAYDALGRTITFGYPAGAPHTEITDARGYKTSYVYSGDCRITQVRDNSNNLITSNTYNATTGYVTSQTDARGHSMSIAYSTPSGGFQAVVTDRNSKTHTYVFNSSRMLTSYTDPLSHTTAWTYDSNNQITGITLPSGRTQTAGYDSAGHVTSSAIGSYSGSATYFTTSGGVNTGLPATITSPGGYTTSITRDSIGRPTVATLPTGSYTSFSYNSLGQPTSITGSDGNSSTIAYTSGMATSVTNAASVSRGYGYDAAGRMTSVTMPGSNVYTSSLDGNNNLLSITGPGSRTTSTTYDYRSRPITTTYPDSTTVTRGWDANHNLTSVTDALSRVTTCVYDNEDRLSSITLPGSRTITFARDNAGRVTSVTSPAGRVTSYTYDADGNVLTVTAPDSTVSTTTYNTAGLIATLVNESSKTTTVAHNTSGLVSSVTSPESKVNSYTYDSIGRLLTSVLPSTKASSVSYNDTTRVRTVLDPASKATAFLGDTTGLLSKVTTNAGRETAYTYWEDDLVDTVTSPSGDTAECDYDAYRMLSSITTDDGVTSFTRDTVGRITKTTEGTKFVSRAYDSLGRLTSYTDQDGNVVGYAYNTAGDLQTITYPDSTTVTYTYDADGLVTKVTDWVSRDTVIARDSKGRISSVTYPTGAKNEYTYTPTGRIASIIAKANGGTAFLSRTLSYSDDGLLTGDSAASAPATLPADATLTFDADNRVATFNGTALTFDADGNMLTGPTGTSPPYSSSTFVYDHRNRLTSAGGITSAYDPEGRRTTVSDSSGDTTYVYDPHEALDKVLVRTLPSSAVTKYVYGPGDVGLLYQDDGGSITAYHFDSRGSTVALSNNSGVSCDTYTYGPFGELLSHTGSSDTPFLYNGSFGVQTDSNGLISMRSRFFSPALKRFINQDSFLGDAGSPLSLNRYAYANGDPISLCDPFGFFATDFFRAAGDWIVSSNIDIRYFGLIRGVGGLSGALAAYTAAGVSAPTIAGAAAFTVGGTYSLDQGLAGFSAMWTGEETNSYFNSALQASGVSEENASRIEMASQFASAGAMLVASRAPQAIESVVTAAPKINGNSLKATGPHDIYVIRDSITGQIYHFGETGRGWAVRGAEWIRKLQKEHGIAGTVEHLLTVEGKAAAKAIETRYITTYRKIFGVRPGYTDKNGNYVPIQKTDH